MMAGGTELDSLVEELERTVGKDSSMVTEMAAEVRPRP